MEEWKDVVGYEGLYEVSDTGKVRSTRRQGAAGGLKKFVENQDGYLRVKLCKGGMDRRFMVHRLVYEAFVGEVGEGLEINHIDENKKNNNRDNLEAVSHIQNVRHGTGIERMRENHYKAVEQYTKDGRLVAVYPSIQEAGEQTPANRCNISWCCRGHSRTAGGYIWKYANGEGK